MYQRVLAGEPDAPSDLIALLLDPLIASLTHRFPNLTDPNLIVDTATDSLFRLVQNPSHFHSERGTLWNYLVMDALGDLRNAWKQECRRLNREQSFDPVAHDRPDGNSDVEGAIIRKLAPDGLPEGTDVSKLIAQLRVKITNPQDWQVVLLMAGGERKTEAYAHVLGIANLPPADQRRRVKQAKDRLRVMLKRLGAAFNEQ
ncbi:MAG: hypothetical protein ACUVSW_00030 [Roseiflexus sp.]